MHDNRPVTLGDWMITTLILAIPIVNIIMILVWAFSSSTNPSKRTYCQAILVWCLIAGIFVAIAGITGQFSKV